MSSCEAMCDLRDSELTGRECPPGRNDLKIEKRRWRSPLGFWRVEVDIQEDREGGETFLSGEEPGTPPERASGAEKIVGTCDVDGAISEPLPRDAAPMRSPNQGEV